MYVMALRGALPDVAARATRSATASSGKPCKNDFGIREKEPVTEMKQGRRHRHGPVSLVFDRKPNARLTPSGQRRSGPTPAVNREAVA